MTKRCVLALFFSLFALINVWNQAQGAQDNRARAAVRSRPAPLTVEQYRALKNLERRPEHRSAAQVPASYSLEEARLEADLTHYGFMAGAPTVAIIVLIAAAPL